MSETAAPAGRFHGKSVLVTGAASGIGRATAALFAREGARLLIADCDGEGLAATLGSIGAQHRMRVFDAADPASCRALVEAASTDGLDVLCNIAGVLDWGPSEDFSEERFERLVRINLFGVFATCRAALPHLVRSQGCIVNMASTAGLTGIAYSAAYSAAKHAVIGLTKSLAAEFAARNVRINAICPGHVDTPMGNRPPPAGDIDWKLVMRAAPKLEQGTCTPDDIARGVAYLASDDARKITGTALVIDGGQLAA
jgi:NAD(P)-dependent dehydrogenase (short-subunit alcohol dehydrogenase family)